MASSLNTTVVLCSKLPASTGSLGRTRPCQTPAVRVCAKSTIKTGLTRNLNGRKQAIGHRLPLQRHAFHLQHHGAIHSPRLPPVQAQMVEFKARRDVDLPFREGAFPAAGYLSELERVVKVMFPDSARITYLGDSIWRTQLKPITFFTLSATPVCDIKVYNKGNTLQILSDQLRLDFSGLPEEYINQSVRFRLAGQLQVDARKGSQHKAGRQVNFRGGVQLSLMADLPLPFSLLPGNVVTAVGDRLLDTILGAMESALVRGIIADYHSWCWSKQNVESNRALRVSGSM